MICTCVDLAYMTHTYFFGGKILGRMCEMCSSSCLGDLEIYCSGTVAWTIAMQFVFEPLDTHTHIHTHWTIIGTRFAMLLLDLRFRLCDDFAVPSRNNAVRVAEPFQSQCHQCGWLVV